MDSGDGTDISMWSSEPHRNQKDYVKSQKSHFHQWKPKTSDPVMLKVTILVHSINIKEFLAKVVKLKMDYHLKKLGQLFQVLLLCLRKMAKN